MRCDWKPASDVVCFRVVQLMELQSRFGADERFRMDSRFLEDGEKEEEESGECVGVDLRSSHRLIQTHAVLLRSKGT